ncbi:SAV0927 family protein [Bacillus sp. FJAT-45350]|uniref:SAV0927 family protein n=1 Tax=Bacillus sp. FJAT-45350 TaxID=2011014 RepID=UPI000BB8051E|nr:SAV0927 family protein [Bacillus sp. FJAT-45350]
MFDVIYHLDENSNVKHVGFIADDVRYDFSIIYTNHFFGKTLISCIQSGKTALLDNSELEDLEFIQKSFKLKNSQEASGVSSFLQTQIPNLSSYEQY